MARQPQKTEHSQTDNREYPAQAAALKSVIRPLRFTYLGLWAEQISRCFWPLWVVFLVCFSLVAFGAQNYGTKSQVLFGLTLAGLSTLAAAYWGWRRFKKPNFQDAITRLDASLSHYPLRSLLDQPALGREDPATVAIWQAHLTKAKAELAKAKPIPPHIRLAARDPFGLRYMALTTAVMAAIFGGFGQTGIPLDFSPNAARAMPHGPSWEGWIRPPHYTGQPTIYLNEIDAPNLEVPEGSTLQLRLYGLGAEALSQDLGTSKLNPSQPGVVEVAITNSGTLAITGEGGRQWQVIARKDTPPVIEAVGPLGREADGRFRQTYKAQDDYALTTGQVSLRLDLDNVTRMHGLRAEPDPIEPVVLDLPMPLSGKREQLEAEFRDNISQSVLANMPVIMQFSVTDAALQTGLSEPRSVIVPGKRFFDPAAAAVIEMRRDLLWSGQNTKTVAQILKAMVYKPQELTRSPLAIHRIKLVISDLDANMTDQGLNPEKRDQLAQDLWEIATLLEEGDLASAKERLERAQDRLEEAIRKGASPEEIDQLMREMQQAMRDYTQELAKQAPPPPEGENADKGEGQTITRDQLQQMLDQIEQLMKEGKTAEAMALMEQLRKLLENLEVQQSQNGQGEGEGGPMGSLGNTLRDQQDLSDDAYRNMQRNRQDNPSQNDESQSPRELAERQRALRDQLNDAQKGPLPGDGSQTTEQGRQELERSERAMREAERRLEQGDLSGALDKQAEALQALREGMREIGKSQRPESDADQNNSRQAQEGGGQSGGRATDPLGREMGNSARIGSDKGIAENTPDQRASKLLEELRRRSGQAQRPENELNYFKRLLDQF